MTPPEDCSVNAANANAQWTYTSQITCFNCGNRGHYSTGAHILGGMAKEEAKEAEERAREKEERGRAKARAHLKRSAQSTLRNKQVGRLEGAEAAIGESALATQNHPHREHRQRFISVKP